MQRLGCFLWLLWTMSAAATAETPSAPSLSAHIPNLMQEADIPGMSIAVIRDGELAWQQQYGTVNVQSNQPVAKDTLFEAASLSKPVLAYISLKMAQREELDLDRPLVTYLAYPRFANHPHSLKVTARHILSHQSGLPNWGDTPLAFAFSPGERFQYSGEGYVYLQKVLEKITGLDLQSLAEREVFKPLSMNNSYFTWQADKRLPVASGHTEMSAPVNREVPSANAASSLHTTAEDYAKFIVAWLDNTHPQRNALRAAFVPQVKLHGDERGTRAPFKQPGLQSWGLGWGLQTDQSKEIAWHWGDNGVFRAFVALNLTNRSAVVYFTNSQNGMAVAQRITESVVGDIANTIRWLDYGQSHEFVWQTNCKAMQAEAKGDLTQAVVYYRQMLAQRPELERYARRITWLEAYLSAQSKPVALSEHQRKAFPGTYGPRNIVATPEGLAYFRGTNAPVNLIQLGQNRFALEGNFDFQLEVATDDSGQPVKLIGHYINGYTDESPRG